MRGDWNQRSQPASMASAHQQASFQPQAAPQLSSNPFQNQTQTFSAPPAQPVNGNLATDDSQMVDNMFAFMGASSKDDGDGLLSALNSVTIEDMASQQEGGNWGSKIAGWSGDDQNPFSSRLGDYREGS